MSYSANQVIFEVGVNPHPDAALSNIQKYIKVFDCFEVFGQNNIPDEMVKHAAAIAAEILDNDENGIVDDQARV